MIADNGRSIKETIKNISRHKVDLHFSLTQRESLIITEKHDQTLVTDFDYSVSDEIKKWKESNEEFKNWTFFSEEDHSELTFPAFILDPIDGTRELIKGRDECVVSLAIMESSKLSCDKKNHFCFIYNPFSGFEICSGTSNLPILSKSAQPMVGLISRSEWELELHKMYLVSSSEMIISPRGSIAFKLALLFSGAADFVVSFKPKSIWDIAAGTVLLNQRGYEFYEKGKLVKDLDKVQYEPPLIWVHPLQKNRLFSNIKV